MDELSELSHDAKQQLRLAKQGYGPRRADRERIHGALAAALAFTASGVTQVAHAATVANTGVASGSSVTTGASLAASQGLFFKAAALVALAGGVAGGIGYQVGYSRGSQAAATTDAQVTLDPIAAIAPTPPISPQPQPAVEMKPIQTLDPKSTRLSPSSNQAALETSTPAGTSAEADEILQLERVQRALRDGYPALAIAILTELDQKVPRGRLHEERAAARVIARCGLSEDASNLAASFANRYPGSMYLERVAAACDTESKKTSAPTTESPTPGQ